ncbi:MAG: pyruvate kinase [Anaerolineae bacterium]
MPRTKIVCTLGPATDDDETVRQMIRAGMAVARLNFSHDSQSAHAQRAEVVRRIAGEEGRVVAVVQDLQGPKLRVGPIDGGQVVLKAGQHFTLTTEDVLGDNQRVTAPYAGLPDDVKPGDRVLLDDGQIELRVTKTTRTTVETEVVADATLSERKGVSLPGVDISLPSLTAKDQEDLAFGIELRVDYVALSFVRQAQDIVDLRDLMAAMGAEIPIIAKVEKPEALANFDEILAVSDGVMVARGDLGVEMPAEEVPIYQKMIIRKANEAAKPVITATQMLESMIRNPRPTRAEASDVANAIFDGTDAVMLSGETAVGRYPVETVLTMAAIAETTERHLPYDEWLSHSVGIHAESVTQAIGLAVTEIAHELDAAAIVASTSSGTTARVVARYRPCMPIIGATHSRRTQCRLSLVWGVEPLLIPRTAMSDEMMDVAIETALGAGLVKEGDLLVLSAGVPVGVPGRTNMLQVRRVGEQQRSVPVGG